jgi:hypothetical protein
MSISKDPSLVTPAVREMFYRRYNPQGPRRSLPEQLTYLGINAKDIDTVVFRLIAISSEFILKLTPVLVMHIGIIVVQSAISFQTPEDILGLAPRSTALLATYQNPARSGMEPFSIRTMLLSDGQSWRVHGCPSARSGRLWISLVMAAFGLFRRQATCRETYSLPFGLKGAAG